MKCIGKTEQGGTSYLAVSSAGTRSRDSCVQRQHVEMHSVLGKCQAALLFSSLQHLLLGLLFSTLLEQAPWIDHQT